jgi:hypothetical protein
LDIVIPLLEILVVGLMVFSFIVRLLPEGERPWMMRLLLLAFGLRLTMATMFGTFPETRIFHEDSDGYDVIAIQMATYYRGEGPPRHNLHDTNGGFLYYLGGLDFVFGRYRVVPSFFHCFLGALICFMVYRLAARMFHVLVAKRAALLVCVMPSMILWSALSLKDALVTFLIVVTLSSCISLKERLTVTNVLGTLLPLAAIQPTRFYITYFVGFAVVVSLAVDRWNRLVSGIYKQLFLAMALLGLFAMVGLSEGTRSDLDYFDLEFVSTYRRGMASTARSGFDHDADVSTPGKALSYMPVGVAHLMFAPFPWQLTALRPLMAAPETIFWWFLFPATVRGIRFAFKRRFAASSPLLIFAVTLTCGYSLIHGNVGSGFRQRAQIFVFLFIYSALGNYLKRCTRAGIDPSHLLANESVGPPPQPPPAPVEPRRLPAPIKPRPLGPTGPY